VPLVLFVAPAAWPAERLVERAPTTLVEAGQPVTLEVVLYVPDGAGPFPTLIFHHGSTGRGDDPSLFPRTFESPAMAQLFNAQGWLVVFPQRRGRGASDGLYDEGFEPHRSGYSCAPAISLAGLARAKQDLDEVLAYLERRGGADAARVLVGGVSRGGILSMAYAAEHPSRFVGVLNFVGGWIGEGCGTGEAINTSTFVAAARFRGPTLWLYGENDPFYSLKHSRKNFRAFRDAGGNGEFVSYSLGEGVNGHAVLGHPDLWRERVLAFVAKLRRAEEAASRATGTSCCSGAATERRSSPPGLF